MRNGSSARKEGSMKCLYWQTEAGYQFVECNYSTTVKIKVGKNNETDIKNLLLIIIMNRNVDLHVVTYNNIIKY